MQTDNGVFSGVAMVAALQRGHRPASASALALILLLALQGCGGDDSSGSNDGEGGSGGSSSETSEDPATDSTGTGGTGGSDTGSGGAGGSDTGSGGAGGSDTGSGGAGGAGGTGGSGDSATAADCSDLSCTAPASCDDSEATPRCVCPDGYLDENGDGSSCTDIDECADGLDDCDAHADCANTDGGFTCTCQAPAYSGDGKSCSCASGYSLDGDSCKADDGVSCAADADCGNGHCVGGTCCQSACDSPGICEKADGASCSDGATCVYADADDGTDCDDGNACTSADTCASGECAAGAAVECDDGLFCNGEETCDTSLGCQAGTAPTVNDGVDCTVDKCDEDNDEVVHTPDHSVCDNGSFCDGAETCDPEADCQDGTAPTTDDGIDCTLDSCDEDNDEVLHVPDHGECDNGMFCDGAETCNPASGCQDGTAPSLDDGVACTDDSCDEDSDEVVHMANDGNCTDNADNACKNDVCDAVLGCQIENVVGDCDDGNPCTVGDSCMAGLCRAGSALDCSDGEVCTDDLCDSGDFDGNPCYYENNNAGCDDENTCTTSDVCTGGDCVGSGNACGGNATDCSPGSPNSCICAEGYSDDGAGSCAPDLNECESISCVDNATCADPSNAIGDAECICNPGFAPDPDPDTACIAIDLCAGDPCGIDDGRATECTQDGPSSYSCTCAANFMPVDDGGGETCSCDLNGMYAIMIATDLSWSGIENVEDGAETTYSWALRNHSYTADGTLEAETIGCGGTSPDICGAGAVAGEAYGQFLPIHIFGLSSMPSDCWNGVCPSASIPYAFAGQLFQPGQTAALLGIELTDPFGAWPASRHDVDGSPANNGAVWANHDEDGDDGVTIYAVPPGGSGSLSVDPLDPYGADSPICPRADDTADRYSYAWWPGVGSGFLGFPALRRVKRFHAASRIISELDGNFDSCDLITGDVIGPDNGKILSEGRFAGCVRCSSGEGANCRNTSCEDALIDFYDEQPQTQQVNGSSFVIKRVPIDTTCEEVRSMSFP
ncbi:MAG: hypothetical protein OEZ06_30705 [Myxococcales bacterium]|nr:hypothetical protein [Myxococcales bacterium]